VAEYRGKLKVPPLAQKGETGAQKTQGKSAEQYGQMGDQGMFARKKREAVKKRKLQSVNVGKKLSCFSASRENRKKK